MDTKAEAEPIEDKPVKWVSTPESVGEPAAAEPTQAPRRRGRPRKNRDGENTVTENYTGPTALPPRPRGRKPKVAAADPGTISRSTKSIMGVHRLAAMVSGLPELEINELEAAMLAESLDRLSREYGFAVNGKIGAVIALIGTCGIIYVPRAMKISTRAKATKLSVVPRTRPNAPETTTEKESVNKTKLNDIGAMHNVSEFGE